VTTFALPDLRGRVPLHPSASHPNGALSGTESVTLTTQQMPQHTHPLTASTTTPGTGDTPANNIPAEPGNYTMYQSGNPTVAMNPGSVTSAGGSQPHSNLQPLLTVSFIIALEGIFPSRN